MSIQVSVTPAEAFPEERDLVERARRDRTAFAALYRNHVDAIAGYVHRRVGDRHVTEDLVADVFLLALRHLATYRFRGLPLRSWLYRIATNRINRWARRERRRTQRLDAEPPVHATNNDGDPARLAAVRHALLQLHPKHQAVLALHCVEGLPVAEVAKILGCRAGTVKSRLSRARQALREHLSSGSKS